MMPGCCIKNSTLVAQNVYVSRYPLIHHGHFGSVRLNDKKKSGVTADLTKLQSEDDLNRETSYQARVRVSEAFKRGELADLVPIDEPVLYKDPQSEIEDFLDV